VVARLPGDDDLNCQDLEIEQFEIVGEDPHGLDGNNDGVACEGPPSRCL
jgi:hypothetical protein